VDEEIDEIRKVQLAGGSLQTTLPSKFCRDMELKEGDSVLISYSSTKKEMIIRKLLKLKRW